MTDEEKKKLDQWERIKETTMIRENMAKTLRNHPGSTFAIDQFRAADWDFWNTLRQIFGGELQADQGPRRLS